MSEEQARFGRVPIRYLLPNLITLLALCSGITAIRLGIEGRYELAVGAVIVAIVLDAVDGRLARFLKGTSRFGAELDSLADFVNFGVAPAILLYVWSLEALRGWVAALILAIACALRLARFNVALDDLNKPAWKNAFFAGAPAPAGAGLAMVPMYLGFLADAGNGRDYAWAVLPYTIAVALLMVSPVPTYSGKNFGKSISRAMVLPILGAAVLGVILLATFPWEMLVGIAAIYVLLIPLAMRSWRAQSHADRG
jgi:CDP-diacylglycerol---serine O-phosphatidyltransferase